LRETHADDEIEPPVGECPVKGLKGGIIGGLDDLQADTELFLRPGRAFESGSIERTVVLPATVEDQPHLEILTGRRARGQEGRRGGKPIPSYGHAFHVASPS